MRRILFELLTVLLLAGGILFFLKCASSLARRDYVSALVLLGIGFSVMLRAQVTRGEVRTLPR